MSHLIVKETLLFLLTGEAAEGQGDPPEGTLPKPRGPQSWPSPSSGGEMAKCEAPHREASD